MASAPQPQGASGTQRDRVAQEIIKKKKKSGAYGDAGDSTEEV